MTDKEIIINGVDVSECEYCLKMTKYRCTIQQDVYKCLCEENPNCYHKQLKHKEQALDDIEKIVKQTCSRRCTNDCLGTRKHCGYGQILNIINKIKE